MSTTIAGPGGPRPGQLRTGVEPAAADRPKLYLVRHGRTALNATGALRGHIDVPLDEIGRQQALLVGAELARLQPALVISSPLSRAVETARAVADRVGLPVETDARLTDRGYSQWAGKQVADIVAQWGSLDSAPGVEPVGAVRERALAALGDAARRAGGAPVVVAAHDAVNRIALAAIDPTLGEPDLVPQETGCYNVLAYSTGDAGSVTWSVISVNQLPSAG